MSELFTLDTLQEFFAKRPKGAKLQYKSSKENEWIHAQPSVPGLHSIQDYWRWEPQSKPIDLSPLVGSDALCEFGHGVKRFGFLKEVSAHGEFIDEAYNLWAQCRPVMDKWMAVNSLQVIPKGLVYAFTATGEPSLTLIKIKRAAEGYHWPWEDK